MKELNLIFIRHGQTDYNLEPRRFQGWLDTVLNETGDSQAQKICSRLNESSYKFNKIYCSDLMRTKQTIEPYLTERRFNDIIYTEELRERDSGTLNGKYVEETRSNLDQGETIDDLLNRYGEVEQKFIKRIEGFILNLIVNELTDLEDEDSAKTILLVTHSECVKVICNLFDPEKLPEQPRNCSFYQIKITFDKNELTSNNCFNIPGLSYDWVIYNDNSHLSK